MSDRTILSEVTDAERRATRISNAATEIQIPNLSSTDEQSTITANGSSKRAYTFSQSTNANVSEALVTASGNITAAGESFENWDNSQ